MLEQAWIVYFQLLYILGLYVPKTNFKEIDFYTFFIVKTQIPTRFYEIGMKMYLLCANA